MNKSIIRIVLQSLHVFLFMSFLLLGYHHKTAIYLIYQAAGQFEILRNTQPIEDVRSAQVLSNQQIQNLGLIAEIKKFSVDSLGYKATNNYTELYDDRGKSLLWVITACEPYAFKPYAWHFPLLGEVTYKGFFRKDLAIKEYNHLRCLGYDAEMREVSAWSTLGWFKDPILVSTLNRSKGSLCNLFFHELFHATYYAPGSVDLNENLANFVAHKATCRFLAGDTAALNHYLEACDDRQTYTRFMFRQMQHLQKRYAEIQQTEGKYLLKLREIFDLVDSLKKLPLNHKKPYLARGTDMLRYKNAYFVDYLQYDSKQDSLEEVFNKIYGGKIENLVRYLKQN